MGKHVFCRDLCLERGEPLAGTGNIAERTIIVRWPRGKWRVPRFESVDMSPALAEAIRLAMAAGIHVALVDRVGETDTIPALQYDGIVADFDEEAELAAAIAGITAGGALAGSPDLRAVILCCTDSRRDACCARYGFATYKALVAAADPARFNVLQATHVGGCRFAASLVVLPQRQRYGRLTPEDATPFLAALERSEIYLPAYRGRAGVPETAQVAEHAAMQWAAARGIDQDDVHLDAMDHGDEATVAITGHAGPHRLHLHLASEAIPVIGRCSALVEGEEPKLTTRWRVAAIHADS